MEKIIDEFDFSHFEPSIKAPLLKDQKDRLAYLLKEYQKILFDGGYGIRKSDLKKKNIIDMRSLLNVNNTKDSHKVLLPQSAYKLTDEEREYVKQNGWYSVVPCFSEGVLRVNDCRYIHYIVENIDVDNREVTIKSQDYLFDDIAKWSFGIGVCAKYTWEVPQNEDSGIFIEVVKCMPLYKLYSALNYKEMFTKDDILLWENTLIKYSKEAEEGEHWKDRGSSPEMVLASAIGKLFIKINYRLSLSKPVTKRVSKNSRKTTIDTSQIDENESKRRVRMIGDLVVTSEDIPRRQTRDTVIKYKVASWTTRGHTRTLKSGKVVLVRESIHKRKCLNKDSDNVAPVTIKFRPEKAVSE